MPQRLFRFRRENLPLPFERGHAKRFGELHACLSGITEAVLSRVLKQLEQDGLLARTVFGSRPPLKTEYGLTDFGRSFLPVLAALTEWGNRAVLEHGSFVQADAV